MVGKHCSSLTIGFLLLRGSYMILHFIFPLKSPVAEKLIKVEGIILLLKKKEKKEYNGKNSFYYDKSARL